MDPLAQTWERRALEAEARITELDEVLRHVKRALTAETTARQQAEKVRDVWQGVCQESERLLSAEITALRAELATLRAGGATTP